MSRGGAEPAEAARLFLYDSVENTKKAAGRKKSGGCAECILFFLR